MNKLKELQAKIIEAVPSIKQQMDTRGKVFQERDISLEDVLMTFAYNREYGVVEKGMFDKKDDNENYVLIRGATRWRLNKPLHEQSSDTIYSLHNLLCVKR